MARHLAPGGVLVVDGWIRPDDWRDPGVVDVLGAVTDDALHGVAMLGVSRREGRTSILEMHHLVAVLGDEPPVTHEVDRHALTLFTDDEYRAAFHRAGLAVEVHPSPYPERDRYVGVAS